MRARPLTEAEAAERLGLAPDTLRRWRWAGRGPQHLKLGRAVRYDPAELDRFLAASVRASTGAPTSPDAHRVPPLPGATPGA